MISLLTSIYFLLTTSFTTSLESQRALIVSVPLGGNNHLSGHGDGISFTGTNATIDRNTTNNNYEGGIHIWNGSGKIHDNNAAGNGINYNVHGSFDQNKNL
jgi:hypothetical protein